MGEFSCIDKSISWVIDQQTQSGGWGNDSKSQPYPFYTAMAMGILQLNGICKKEIKAGTNWLIKSQQTDGGWASTEILKVPNPQTNVPPWECHILTSLVQDQQRLYTTASVLQVLNRTKGTFLFDNFKKDEDDDSVLCENRLIRSEFL